MTTRPDGVWPLSPDTPLSVEYPGFGACMVCGYDAEWIVHVMDLTIIYHHGRKCRIYPQQRDQ